LEENFSAHFAFRVRDASLTSIAPRDYALPGTINEQTLWPAPRGGGLKVAL
jgi:hypothetical protein